jgi:hypothetical protein
MEKLYKKVGNRYVSVGYSSPDISDGIWMVQSKPSSKSITSLVWKVGEIKDVVDVTTHAALQACEDDLTKYLMKLSDETTDEYKEARNICGGFMQGPVKLYNISPADIVTLFLRQLAIKTDNKNG